MRAVRVNQFNSLDRVVVEEVPRPSAGSGELLLEVVAAGVNFPDLLMAQGAYQSLPPVPFTLGMEAAGRVVAGGGSDGFVVGDRVLAMVSQGAFAEFLVVPAGRAIRIPDAMPFEDAAAFGLAYVTAHFGLVRRARLHSGETVLVTGVRGGVGHAAVFLAKSLGATVIAVSRDVENARSMLNTAADHVVRADPSTVREEVMDLTGGRGVDVVLDVVGGDLFTELLRVVAWEGRAVVVGFASASQNPVKPGHLLVKNNAVMGVQVTDYYERTPAAVKQAIQEMLVAYQAGLLPVPITAVRSFDEARGVLSELERKAIRGKAVLLAAPAGQVRQAAG